MKLSTDAIIEIIAWIVGYAAVMTTVVCIMEANQVRIKDLLFNLGVLQ